MFGRNKRVDERLERIEELLVGLGHDAELLRTVLIIREPDTVTAANAYEGLRKQIVAVAQEHWAHLAQLVEIDVSINHTDDIEVARRLSDEWITRSGVLRVGQSASPGQLSELFEDLGGSGPIVEIRSPAYVDGATGRLIRKGRLARTTQEPAIAEPIQPSTEEDEDAVELSAVETQSPADAPERPPGDEEPSAEPEDLPETPSVTDDPKAKE